MDYPAQRVGLVQCMMCSFILKCTNPSIHLPISLENCNTIADDIPIVVLYHGLNAQKLILTYFVLFDLSPETATEPRYVFIVFY